MEFFGSIRGHWNWLCQGKHMKEAAVPFSRVHRSSANRELCALVNDISASLRFRIQQTQLWIQVSKVLSDSGCDFAPNLLTEEGSSPTIRWRSLHTSGQRLSHQWKPLNWMKRPLPPPPLPPAVRIFCAFYLQSRQPNTAPLPHSWAASWLKNKLTSSINLETISLPARSS